MNVTTLKSYGDEAVFSLVGKCPHCSRDSVCIMVTQSYPEQTTPGPINVSAARRFSAVTQCQGCREYVLAVVTREAARPGVQPTSPFVYEAHYPMGKPDDSIDEGIPSHIGEDFQEALRCMFVNAYNATVCMCGRALESACLDLQAEGKTLEDKIDDLEKKRQISSPLKDMAHHIRLTRNRGAHAPTNGKQEAEKPTKEHAEALIAFTRQFFLTVYTMRFKLQKFTDNAPVTAE